jgi:hypothetical protein
MGRLKISRIASATQATSKSTAVDCGADSGVITMNAASLAAGTSVSFTVNNGYVDANDTINACIASGATTNSYLMCVDAVAAGSFRIHVRNMTAGALAEALVINFSVIKNG